MNTNNILVPVQTKAVKTYLKCELNEIWKLLLTPEFLDAYVHGVVVECANGILCCLYPQFFTYSADYPEKYVWIAYIRVAALHLDSALDPAV